MGLGLGLLELGLPLESLEVPMKGKKMKLRARAPPISAGARSRGSLVVGARVGLASCRGWAWLYLVVGIITTLRTTMNVSSEHL